MSNGSLMVIVLYVVEDLIAQRFVLVIVKKSLSELNNLFAKLMVQRLFGGEFIHDEDSSL